MNCPRCMIVFFLSLSLPFLFSSPLLKFITSVESDYLELSSKVITSFANRCSNPCKPSYYGCGTNFPFPSKCNEKFILNKCQCLNSNMSTGSYLNDLESTVSFPVTLAKLLNLYNTYNQEIKELICATEFLGKEFKILSDKYPMAKWQYFGGYVEMIRDYPAQEICNFINYVSTTWFVSSTTGPKNIVFIIDVSESMNYKNKINYVINALVNFVRTLGFRDWAGLVIFNSTAQTFKTSMIRMSNQNKEEMIEFIKKLQPQGLSNYEEGFKAAYEVYAATQDDDYSSINCQTIFMFFSDGKPNMGESQPENLINLIKSWDKKTNANAHISLFNIARKNIENLLHLISCAMKGYYFYIPSYNRITEFIAKFILLIHIKQSGPVWSEPYFDNSGLGWVITLNYAIHDENNFFIGVLGIDFLYESLSNLDPSINLTKILSAQTNKTCENQDSNDCKLEKGRTLKCDKHYFDMNCNQIDLEIVTCENLKNVQPFFEGTHEKYEEDFNVCCEKCDAIEVSSFNFEMLILILSLVIGFILLVMLIIYKWKKIIKSKRNQE